MSYFMVILFSKTDDKVPRRSEEMTHMLCKYLPCGARYSCAFPALPASPGAPGVYEPRRETKKR